MYNRLIDREIHYDINCKIFPYPSVLRCASLWSGYKASWWPLTRAQLMSSSSDGSTKTDMRVTLTSGITLQSVTWIIVRSHTATVENTYLLLPRSCRRRRLRHCMCHGCLPDGYPGAMAYRCRYQRKLSLPWTGRRSLHRCILLQSAPLPKGAEVKCTRPSRLLTTAP
jgi:hypothetical protein